MSLRVPPGTVISDGGRIAALRALALLDTAPEEDFDRFTRLASDLLGVPISLVSLVDRDRQFFKSQYGLPSPWSEARETPLSHSFCQHAVATGHPLIVEDARRSALVADNLAVRDLSVMAYAGIPLTLADGHAVGALCAIDTAPRHWSDRDLRILGDLAAAVQALIDLRYAAAHQRLHDHLTDLPNRALTIAYAGQMAGRHSSPDLLAVTVGVNDLGAINEVYGTVQGDRILKLVARRIASELGPDDVLGRLEGDTFVVLRTGVSDQLQALALAHRIREGVGAQAVRVRGDQLPVTVTAGIATLSPGESTDAADHLITRAVEAMRMAKGHRGRMLVADCDRGLGAARRLRLRGALRGAVTRGEITVAFQPIVELASGTTAGFEALARWEHPDLGEVTPADFIPVAEAGGEIVRIGEFVLRAACRQLSAWRAESEQDLTMAVNVSPVQLAVPNFAEILRSVLLTCRLPGEALALEITEGVFMTPGVVAARNLEQIRQLGVRIALDDFGTGYSALSYLKRFPVDVIKADRSFLDGLGADRRDLAVVRAILAIGDGMDIPVIAEGIETPRQRELLRLSGCPYGQGYLFGAPAAADEIVVDRRVGRTGARGERARGPRLVVSPAD